MSLISNSKNKNMRDLYRDINEFKKGYQPRTNLVKDPHKIVNRWMNHFRQLLNFQDIRQTEIQTAEAFVPEPIISEFEVAIGKLKRSPGADQIPAELIQAGGKHYILRSTNLLS
jgi:hypothetical protein